MSAPKKAKVAGGKTVYLFDVDGTLTVARKEITPEMADFMNECRKVATVALVGGSDLSKQREQLGENVLNDFEYLFSENGLVAFKDGKELATQSFQKHLGDEKLQKLINFILGYLSKITLPCKRGTFIEYRTGMLNVSPIGRACSREERNAFEKYDQEHNIRSTMVDALKKEFADFNLTYSIGGQISFDVFPQGWDKTFCLPFLLDAGFTEIHFFGDKTYPGGNDHEIFEDPRTIGHTVTCWQDTKKLLEDMLFAGENKSAEPVAEPAAKEASS